MDAEILFFMSAKDQSEFLSFANKSCDSIVEEFDQFQLRIGDCELLFTPSIIEGNTRYCGKFEIRIGPSDKACKDQERAKSTFRKLRNYIKKNYWSRLAYTNKKGKLTPSRNHWLAPDAKKWKDSDPDKHILKLSKTSWMVFDIGF